jgi:hypothetical protein
VDAHHAASATERAATVASIGERVSFQITISSKTKHT